jgi:hypothetical protein
MGLLVAGRQKLVHFPAQSLEKTEGAPLPGRLLRELNLAAKPVQQTDI